MSDLLAEPPATLADVVAPLGVAEFMELLHRRELCYRPDSNGHRYAPSLGWAALRRILGAGEQSLEREGIRVTKESHLAPPERWMTDGKVDPAKLDAFLAAGYSVVVLRVEAHLPALASVCEDIKTRLGDGSFVGAVVTRGTGAGAFKVHFDPEDLIILQVEGTKRWQVFGPPVPNPLRRMPKQSPPDTPPILDEVLEPGDLLFVPGGYWHHCESGLSTSVHLGIFFLPPTGWHAIQDMVRPLIEEEVFRRPLTRLDGDAARGAVQAELKQRLIDKIHEMDLEGFVARWHKEAY